MFYLECGLTYLSEPLAAKDGNILPQKRPRPMDEEDDDEDVEMEEEGNWGTRESETLAYFFHLPLVQERKTVDLAPSCQD